VVPEGLRPPEAQDGLAIYGTVSLPSVTPAACEKGVCATATVPANRVDALTPR
jgi:hypothetical protein